MTIRNFTLNINVNCDGIDPKITDREIIESPHEKVARILNWVAFILEHYEEKFEDNIDDENRKIIGSWVMPRLN
jgi:hypothetical protein